LRNPFFRGSREWIAVDVDGHGCIRSLPRIVAGAIAQAREQHAGLVLIRLNTPGGLNGRHALHH